MPSWIGKAYKCNNFSEYHYKGLAMELFLSSTFTCVSFLVVSTAGMNVNFTTIGCTVLMQWNKETHSEFYIDIWNANGKDHLGIETSRSRFTYADVQPGQSYNITWTPIGIINNKRDRERTLKEENYVVIPNDCSIQTSSSEISSTPKTDSILQSSSSEISPTQSSSEISPTQETDHGFCTIYFWVSVFAFPGATGAVMVLMYFCVIRKFQGMKHRQQNEHQTGRSAGVNVKSTCYSNDATQNYYEVQYSLAQEIGLEYCN